jgi:hyperosmotically inducible protein
MTASRFAAASSRFGWVLGAVIATGPLALEARAASIPDAWITTKTKLALLTKDHSKTDGIHVDTVDGRITLYGAVNSESQKRHAGETARAITGAKTVHNLLQIVAASSEEAVTEADDQIKESVESALKADASLAGSDISVASVVNGAVLLSGTAGTLSAHLSAMQTANSVVGVRSVASEIKAPEKLSDAEISRVAASVEDAARDGWITTDVKLRLLADRDVPTLDVSVDTYRGVVSLFGAVPSAEAKTAAVADAQKVDSVLGVNDDLHVVTRRDRQAIRAEDDVVKSNVEAAFKTCPELGRVDVEVKDGRAHLSGMVASGMDRLRAATMARGAKGVRSVDQDIQVDQLPGTGEETKP